MNSNYLVHHGVKGMKWGVRHDYIPVGRNGKPLTEEERKARNKRLLKIGAGVAAGILIGAGMAYGIKSGKFKQLVSIGKKATHAGIDDSLINKVLPKSETTIAKAVKNANPLHGKMEGRGNCVPSSLATYFNTKGLNAKAKSVNGKSANLGGVIEECFSKPKNVTRSMVLDGTAVKWGSKESASKMLINRYGDNASGVVGIQFNESYVKAVANRTGNMKLDAEDLSGHAFNWEIKNGVVSFFDGQKQLENCEQYFKWIDTNGSLTLARLDDLIPNWEALAKYVG